MKIAIVLIYNKGDQGNKNQLDTLLSNITYIKNIITDPTDKTQIDDSYWSFNGCAQPHRLLFHQSMPFGVTMPPRYGELKGTGTLYGKSAVDPQVYNDAIIATNQLGSDIMIIVEDISQLSAQNIDDQITGYNKALAVKAPYGKVISKEIPKQYGFLNEKISLDAAITEIQGKLPS